MTHTKTAHCSLIITALVMLAFLFPVQAELSGSWTKKANKAHGKWSILTESGKDYVKLGAKFKTKSALELKIFLFRDAASSLTGKMLSRTVSKSPC